LVPVSGIDTPPPDSWKVPLLALLVIAPVMGGLYAFFLPFIGFVMVAGFLGRKLTSPFRTTPSLD
jgi:antibiotic biosynthesis monooxygenase (ABM) superfamily enzyme